MCKAFTRLGHHEAEPSQTPPRKRKLSSDHHARPSASRETRPLAEYMRPDTLDDFVGQQDLVGERGILRGVIEQDQLPSFILWGSPGTGKTTLARVAWGRGDTVF